MYEEVPRSRRGLAAYLGGSRLTARRIVLGPFVIGGGVVLATVGGSVAVAATVFTASTIRASDVPPRPHPVPIAVSSSASSKPSRQSPHPAVPAQSSSTAVGAVAVPSGPPTPAAQPSSSRPNSSVDAGSPGTTARTAGSPSGTASTTATAASPSSSPTATPSPSGNALVYISGWNSDRKQLVFQFAAVSKGTGPQHSDVYSIASPKQYTATLANDIRIISGGLLCPPAGSSCTVDQLIAAAAQGFYAEVAVDPLSAVHEILERDNAAPPPVTPTPAPTPTSTAAFGPAPSPTPSASTTP